MKMARPTLSLQKVTQTYRRIFSIAEIEVDPVLQWSLGFLLLSLFLNLKYWSVNLFTTVTAFTNHTATCWPFFQNCASLAFLNLPPDGYSQVTFFTILLILMAVGAFSMYRKNWVAAHFCILVPYIARLYLILISANYFANFWLYITYFGFIFLLLPHKKFFGQLMVVMCYFLSTSSKISEAWTLGTYFSNMEDGIPLFPWGSEIFLTNLALFMEMAGSWMLFSGNKKLQRSTLAFFIIFHFYSVFIVGQNFPAIILPWLVLLFGTGFTPYRQLPVDNKSISGWSFMALLVFIQIIPLLIPGDENYTQEGTTYEIHMINVNNQCRYQLIDINGAVIKSGIGNNPQITGNCWLYGVYFHLQSRYCPSNHPLRFIFDHSVNGHPYYRVVDVPNLCGLTYKPFSHNTWINDSTNSSPLETPIHKSNPVISYIAQTSMMGSMKHPAVAIPTKSPPNHTDYTTLQRIFAPYILLIQTFWWSLWWGLLAYLISCYLIFPVKAEKRG